MSHSTDDIFPIDDNSDEDNFQTIVPARDHAASRHFSADDRPITPMKNTMIYKTDYSSLDFKDGIELQ